MMRDTLSAMLLVIVIATPTAAPASRAVKRTITACVHGGELVSDGYTYRVRANAGAVDTDLGRYEGRRIRVKGHLLPGDILISESIEIVPGSCPKR